MDLQCIYILHLWSGKNVLTTTTVSILLWHFSNGELGNSNSNGSAPGCIPSIVKTPRIPLPRSTTKSKTVRLFLISKRPFAGWSARGVKATVRWWGSLCGGKSAGGELADDLLSVCKEKDVVDLVKSIVLSSGCSLVARTSMIARGREY